MKLKIERCELKEKYTLGKLYVYDLIKDKLNKKGGKINIISTKDDVSKIILDIVKGNK